MMTRRKKKTVKTSSEEIINKKLNKTSTQGNMNRIERRYGIFIFHRQYNVI